MKISDLKPNEKNPRTISESKLEMLKNSLEEFGDLSGIVFNRKTKQLVGGHQRIKLVPSNAKVTVNKTYKKPTRTGTVAEGYIEFGGEKYNYREVNWNLKKEKAANIAANKGAGEWDMELLTEWMKDLSEDKFDLDLTMFDSDERKQFGLVLVSEHSRLGATGVDEDEIPEKAPPRSKMGQVWELGEHRVMCGDSTNKEMVDFLMNGEKADLWLTDPPYGVAYRSNGAEDKHKEIANDSMPLSEMKKFWQKVSSNAVDACGDRAAYYWFACQGGDQMMMMMMMALGDGGWQVKHELMWLKNTLVLGRCDYHYKHEPILYGWKKEGVHDWFGDRAQTTVLEAKKPASSDLHPTMKPIELLEPLVKNSSKEGMLVLDLFGGSGSTLIACEKTKRKCFMMELEPHYVDVIIDRWEKYTGLKAKLVTGPVVKTKKSKDTKANGEVRA